MATQFAAVCARPPPFLFHEARILRPNASPSTFRQSLCRHHRPRPFSASPKLHRQHNSKESFGTRLRRALKDTKITWYPIPAALGIGFLGFSQVYKKREEARRREEDLGDDGYVRNTGSKDESGNSQSEGGRPKKRERIRPTGPWYARPSTKLA